MNDAAKLALWDDLVAQVSQGRTELKLVAEENQRLRKKMSAIAWNLECSVRIAKDLPPLKDEDEAPENQMPKRKSK